MKDILHGHQTHLALLDQKTEDLNKREKELRCGVVYIQEELDQNAADATDV